MINEGRVQKRKIYEDFENELRVKGKKYEEKYSNIFRQILNSVYKHSPHDIRPNITRFDTLSVLVVKNHMYIYIEVDENRKYDTLLSVTMPEDVEKGGTYNLPLHKALLEIDKVCRSKT